MSFWLFRPNSNGSRRLGPQGPDRQGESEEKFLIDRFLTLCSGTSCTCNENLRPLLNRNIPLISGKYGLRNHFWPLESRFIMGKSEKKGSN